MVQHQDDAIEVEDQLARVGVGAQLAGVHGLADRTDKLALPGLHHADQLVADREAARSSERFLSGQIVIDIRHPDAQEDEPLVLEGIEVQAMPFYAINSKFKHLDPTRQYLLLASSMCQLPPGRLQQLIHGMA
jgi:thiazole biosynthesis-like protein